MFEHRQQHPMSPRKKIRIRRLVQPEKVEVNKSKIYFKFIGFLVSVLCVIAFLWKNQHFHEELKHLAMNQFQLYLHGRENYCDEPFEHWYISNVLHHRIIGQESALNEIDQALQQHENTTSMALVGTHGIGKTLTLHFVQQHFQWHLNTHSYVWSLIESPENQLKRLSKLIDGLSTCGQNGIFVDSIPIHKINLIDEFNRRLLDFSNENRIKVIAFYAFQADQINEADDPLQIDNVKWIRFRQFNSDDIRNCINMESDRLNITITPGQIDEVLASVDIKRFGCKSVAAKIGRLVA